MLTGVIDGAAEESVLELVTVSEFSMAATAVDEEETSVVAEAVPVATGAASVVEAEGEAAMFWATSSALSDAVGAADDSAAAELDGLEGPTT